MPSQRRYGISFLHHISYETQPFPAASSTKWAFSAVTTVNRPNLPQPTFDSTFFFSISSFLLRSPALETTKFFLVSRSQQTETGRHGYSSRGMRPGYPALSGIIYIVVDLCLHRQPWYETMMVPCWTSLHPQSILWLHFRTTLRKARSAQFHLSNCSRGNFREFVNGEIACLVASCWKFANELPPDSSSRFQNRFISFRPVISAIFYHEIQSFHCPSHTKCFPIATDFEVFAKGLQPRHAFCHYFLVFTVIHPKESRDSFDVKLLNAN